MVRGFESFQSWFAGYEDCYTIIGGTACDLIMSEAGQDFRATKDIDLVLILIGILNRDRRCETRSLKNILHRNNARGVPSSPR